MTCSIAVKASGGTDWPQWRADEHRTAAVAWSLPTSLYQQWRHDYPPTAPARVSYAYGYPLSAVAAKMERCLWSVVEGKTLYVALGISDCVAALDTDTGAEKWRFYANGPVRGAPAGVNGKVYVGSDDGWVYCLDGSNGQVVWKKALGPTNRKMFGDSRMISPWMARAAGPLVADGKVYVFSGYWAPEGLFGYAFDAATGEEIWKNDGLSCADSIYSAPRNYPERHCTYPRRWASPGGWLTLAGDRQRLLLGCGYEGRTFLDRATGGIIAHQSVAMYEYIDYLINVPQYSGGITFDKKAAKLPFFKLLA